MTEIQVRGPLGADVLGTAATTAPQDVQAIVDAARAAQPAWSRRTLADRADMLEAAADSLSPHEDELGVLLAAESGKPLAQARFEVHCAIGLLRGNAQVGRRMAGTVIPTEGQHGTEHDIAWTRREPLGVVAAILPFNFPVELFIEKAAAALVAGNAVVCKAPPEDPLVVARFHAAMLGAGVPSEVLALVHGDRDTGAALAQADGVDAISLTGSTAAGIAVAKAAAPTLRRLHLELGGNNAAIVLKDADLELAATELSYGRLLMNGQACSASKRIIVARELHDQLSERLAATCAGRRVGPATDAETTLGPLITPVAAERVAGQIRHAIDQGATLSAGDAQADGAYVAPTLLTDVPASADIAADDEVFGPVFTLIPVDGMAEAIAVANGSSFGLMGSVFTADLGRAVHVAERLRTGGVVINGTDNYRPPNIPFGGVGLSGGGREGLGYTITELSREKTIVLRRIRNRFQEDE